MTTINDFENIEITKENVHEYELAYINEYGDLADPNSSFYDNDDELKMSTVTEMNNIVKTPKEKEIWWVSYPFNNTKRTFKNRPCVFINANNELKAVYISSYQEDRPSKVKKAGYSYVSLLKDWRSEGLYKPSLVCGFSRRSLSEITLLDKVGEISDYDYNITVNCIRTFDELKYDNPYNFLNWLLSNNIKDTILVSGSDSAFKRLQIVHDIEISKRANCIDIANAVHYICNKNNDKHWVVNSNFYKDRNILLKHIYAPYYWNNMHHVLFYNGNNDFNTGEMHKYEGINIKELVYKETVFLEDYFREVLGEGFRDKSFILPRHGLTKWDEFVKNRDPQRNLLQYYFPFK